MDPSGALVVGAEVRLVPADAAPKSQPVSTLSGPTGEYRLLAGPGTYTIAVKATGFAPFQSARFQLAADSPARSLDIWLSLEVQIEKIDVPVDQAGDPARSGTAIVLSSRDIETMPLDSAALLDELQGLAGGQDAQLYVDGFSGAKLPPRSSIREIRINQNPYSAQNDTNPINGVIQVSTKPGTDKTHGEFYLYGDDSALNAGNPFVPGQPPYFAFASGASLGGPVNRRLSYTASFDQATNQTNSLVNAQVLDANLNPMDFSQALASPSSSIAFSPRADFQAAPRSTMVFRYTFNRNLQTNGGISQLSLASQGFDSSVDAHTLQVSNSQIISANAVNDTRLQYVRQRSSQTPVSSSPTILVQGAFTGGGNPMGASSDHQDRFELQNYLALARGTHYINTGGRLRVGRDANRSNANYNGEFIFSSLNSYQTTVAGMQAGSSMTQITAAGGGASQFLVTAGAPDAAISLADGALFLQDDWKLRRTLTLSFGLRFETQTYIADHADWAPRVGFSWGFWPASRSAAPRFVLHGGAGIFYKRFASDAALQVQRQNGVSEQQYVVLAPGFYPYFPTPTALGTQSVSSLYQVSSGFHAPYFIGTTIALDRTLSHFGTLSVTYLNNRGVHTQLTENVNAPLPGTYNPANPSSGVRPMGSPQNVYQFVSEGVYRSSRVSTNLTLRAGSRFYIFGYYMLRFDRSDADTNGGFPSNSYNLGADYSRSLGDTRHTATIGGNANLAHGVHGSGYVRVVSGAPFNIVVGQDLNGDTQYNDRPAFATDLSRTSVVVTRWGTFDTSPLPTQTIIPRNFGQGPGLVLVNLALGKSFGVGHGTLPANLKGGRSNAQVTHKYTMDFWAESQNLLNHPNLAPPVGTLGSSLFGRSLAVVGASALSPDRVVDLQMSMRF